MAETQLTHLVSGVSPAADPVDGVSTPGATTASGLNRRTLVQGTVGSIAILVGSLGTGGDLVHDPILGNSPFSWIRYGHGQQLAQALLYVGVGLLVWAWIRLGRDIMAKRVAARGVLVAGLSWIAPMIVAPPTFTRDVFSYLAEGQLSLRGLDPYAVGPSVLGNAVSANVHPFWVNTPAPYGPLFILLAKGVAWVVGENLIPGVILMRLGLMVGLVLLIAALPGLTRHLGGRLSVALWLSVASPMVVIHLVGGPHNDLLMIGLLAMGTLLVLQRKHTAGIALVTLGMAVKATAGVALPFLMWVWAGRMQGTLLRRFIRATAAVIGIVIVVFGASMLAAGVNFGWIPALKAPMLIVNWVNLPTGIGELMHGITNLFGSLAEQPFDNMMRAIGDVVLAILLIRQWWLARDGGIEAVRRGGIALLMVAILSPPTLPWYFMWGIAIVGATPWRNRWLAFSAALTVLILLVYYPNGEGAMGDLGHMLIVILLAILTWVSMLRPDPLRLRSRPPVGLDGALAGENAGGLPTAKVSVTVPAEKAAEPEQPKADAEVVVEQESVSTE
jgi:alpha-1,6-mannosyltransferase